MHSIGSDRLLTVSEAEAPYIEVPYIEDSYVVSPLQEGMLFHSLFAPSYPMYVRQIIVSLRETLNVPILKQSWERVIGRHPILRSSLRWE
jgi:surfactin family lipopeptide synthetase C